MGAWEVVGFGHADGDSNYLRRVVLAVFDTAEEAIDAYHNRLNQLEAAYEEGGGDVLLMEFSVQHNGIDMVRRH
jgi:hypothetical protein